MKGLPRSLGLGHQALFCLEACESLVPSTIRFKPGIDISTFIGKLEVTSNVEMLLQGLNLIYLWHGGAGYELALLKKAKEE